MINMLFSSFKYDQFLASFFTTSMTESYSECVEIQLTI